METMILKDTENGNVSTKIETWTYLISTYAMNISNYFVSSPPALFFDVRDCQFVVFYVDYPNYQITESCFLRSSPASLLRNQLEVLLEVVDVMIPSQWFASYVREATLQLMIFDHARIKVHFDNDELEHCPRNRYLHVSITG